MLPAEIHEESEQPLCSTCSKSPQKLAMAPKPAEKTDSPGIELK